MRRRVVSTSVFSVTALFIAAQLFVAHLSASSTSLRVDETKTRLALLEDHARASLAVDNSSAAATRAHIRLELLDTGGGVRAAGERDETIGAGPCELVIPVPFAASKLSEQERSRLAWYRLRYRVSLPADSVEGIISLSEITPDLFDLEIVGSAFAFDGMRYRARARAVNPASSRPVGDVAVRAELRFDDDPSARTLKASAVTDSEGFAVLDLELPQNTVSREAEITVTASRGGYAQEVTGEIRFERLAQLLISVDKPIYRPGQLLHLRVLALDLLSRRAVAEAPVSVKISDPEGTDIFRSTINTSRHGIANLDWPIPESTRLGEYMIEVEIREGKYEDSIAGRSVKISRYELPNFVVNVKADRPYYLPGRDALVEVRADYLFGQPVTRGRVRIVQESERSWNYHEQKWEVTEGDEYKGETDKAGRFIANIKLGGEHAELKEHDYSRFRDVSFAAYLTDPTTNKTEQRRFDLRMTKQAIHVYVVEGNNSQSARLPFQFYVTTFYADGSPAECEVAITEPPAAERSIRPRLPGPALARVKTNRYGLAKVSSLIPSNSQDSDDELRLVFSARDRLGRTGSHTEHFNYDEEEAVIRVETAKTLHRPGEPIRAEITTSKPDLAVIVDAVSDNRVIRSELVRLRGGRGVIIFPYLDDFKNEVIIAAYSRGGPDGLAVGSRKVLYPRASDLKIEVAPGQPTYQPGQDASATISVRAPDGRAVESALGVVVIDKAVEERARTDQEFGSGGGFHSAFLGGDSFAGLTRADLDRVDLSKPLPDGLDLAAEVMLNQGGGYYPRLFGGGAAGADQLALFAGLLGPQFKPVTDALNKTYREQSEYPADENTMRRLLAESGIDFESLRDPWGDRYRAVFSTEAAHDALCFESAGADKRFDTADDFTVTRLSWPYFRPIGEALDRAASDYYARTGGFIRDRATLNRELRRQADQLERAEAIELDRLRDRWGAPYRIEFGISQTRALITVHSGGPDPVRVGDDFTIWTSRTDYFTKTRDKIAAALDDHFKSRALFPEDESELSEALAGSGIDRNRLRDPWGSRYYASFSNEIHYGERVSLKSQAVYPGKLQHRTEVTPVTLHIRYLLFRSAGPDGKQGTHDDFDVGRFSRIISEQSAEEPAPQPRRAPVMFSGKTGAISGVITDLSGAVIAGATVKATHASMMLSYHAKSNDEGRYFLNNLAAGMYQVTFDADNFKSAIYIDVVVNSSSVVRLDAALEPGAVTETVTVASGSEALMTETTQASVSEEKIAQPPARAPGVREQSSTPRLREHFPETLLWQPEIVTDAGGHAQLRFKLADNITTWKVAVIASTVDGRVGIAEKEFRAFQPFFIEHDPPPVLTEGDRIELPIVLRNYLDRAQQIALEIKPENWFALAGPARKQTEVAAGDARRETFSLRAVAAVKDGKQRVTARGADAGDAVEKSVTVHPDGQEITETASQLFNDSATLEIDLPANTIKNSAQAELKIYPNLMTHVIESIEAIMQRPYGCAEQTISSAYPSLLMLRYYKHGGEDFPPPAQKARRYVQAGYERLLGYRDAGGGFSYWSRGEADLALTAHALRFLAGASEFVSVDEGVVEAARRWVIKQQRKDGSWPAPAWSGGGESRQTAMLTSFVARALAASQPASAEPSRQAEIKAALKRALDYLARPVAGVDEPYLIASYAMAAADAGERELAERARARLHALARDEAGSNYWVLETNTPFYGWGLAGRTETTALAVQALAKDCKAQKGDCAQLIDRGLLFLLRQKDRYGVWYSTQATVNVLDALVTLLQREAKTSGPREADWAEVFVNGRAAERLALPPATRPSGPVRLSITSLLSNGKNRVEIRRPGSSPATAQAVVTYYVPWAERRSDGGAASKGGLRLGVTFDKTTAAVGDEITCRVEAERAGFIGYGMMLAEIGLPPGAEVDRASLERAVEQKGWEINQYDVLPDRVIVYLWPRAGGTRLDFKFRARFGLAAQSAPSLLYDYYNPEARAVIAPTRFVITEK